MTLRHLEIFAAIADHGTMSGAARALYIAQPTVSQAVAELESAYQVRLFERLSRRLYLTPEGRDMLGYARHILASVDEMERRLQDAAGRPLLRVGATITVATCLMPSVLSRFEASHPDTRVKAWVGNTRSIEERVLSSQLDLGFVEGEASSPDIRSIPAQEDELILVASPTHPLAARGAVTARDLQGMDFVLREPGSGTRALFEQYLKDYRVRVEEKWTCNNSEAIKNAVIGGQGLTVISRLLVQRELDGRLLVCLPLQERRLTRRFSLILHKHKYLSPSLEAFLDVCGAGQ